jgi:hypothetical protein
MAWQVTEQGKDQSLTISREMDVSIFQRTFIVWQDDPAYTGTTESSWNVYLSVRSATTAPWNKIEKVGNRIASGSVDALKAQFIVSDLSVNPHPDRSNTYIVKQTSRAPLVNGQSYRGTKITQQTRMRQVQTWMVPNSFPTAGDVNPWNTTPFISGTVYNISGNPFTLSIPQIIYTIEFPVHRPASDLGYNITNTAMADFSGNVNKRNDGDWLDVGDSGKFLFAAAEQRQLTEQVSSFVNTFIFDPWYHLEQVPVRLLNGELQLDTSFNIGAAPSTPIAQRGTSKVIWRQPYAGKIAFDVDYNVLPPGIESIFITPKPLWP